MNSPLSILDLAPLTAGGTTARRAAPHHRPRAARRAVRATPATGWPSTTSPPAWPAAAGPAAPGRSRKRKTAQLRLGSGAVQTGHQTALSIVEQFGLLDALYPGRFDLGLGRSGQRRKEALKELAAPPAVGPREAARSATARPRRSRSGSSTAC